VRRTSPQPSPEYGTIGYESPIMAHTAISAPPDDRWVLHFPTQQRILADDPRNCQTPCRTLGAPQGGTTHGQAPIARRHHEAAPRPAASKGGLANQRSFPDNTCQPVTMQRGEALFHTGEGDGPDPSAGRSSCQLAGCCRPASVLRRYTILSINTVVGVGPLKSGQWPLAEPMCQSGLLGSFAGILGSLGTPGRKPLPLKRRL
jgi:hypothetical protein